MTAIAPAPASGHPQLALHSSPPAHGALSQARDPLAFAAVLDSVPGGDAKAKPSSGEQAQTPTDLPRDRPQTQIPNSSLFNAALPVATPPTIANGEPVAGTNPPALAPRTAAQRPAPDASSATRAASAAEAGDALGARPIDERSFHASGAASSLPTDGPSSADQSPPPAMLRPSQATAPSPPVSPSTAPVASASHAERTPPAGSGLFGAGRAKGERQADPAATVARVAVPAAGKPVSGPEAKPPRDESGSDGFAGPPANGGANAFQSTPSQSLAAVTQPLTAAYADPQSRLLGAATGPGAPRAAQAPATSTAPSAAPVREIDVDLSPGGLEDVSMTMRLAGDKLSLVIRAGSSQTTGAIEGARDAIAERLAAIGQPLGSLIIQQTGSTTDATNAGSSGAGRGEDRPQGRGGDANDPRGARRGSAGF
jgi:hypothetical protein